MDTVGIWAGIICMIHCLATPVLFIARASASSYYVDVPVWWEAMDYVFIVISFLAIFFATRKANKSWIRVALWSTWTLLLLAILNETWAWVSLSEALIYVPASVIVGLHFYHLKYGARADDTSHPNANTPS